MSETLQKHATIACKQIPREQRDAALQSVSAVIDVDLPESAASASRSVCSSTTGAASTGAMTARSSRQMTMQEGLANARPYDNEANMQHNLLLLRWVIMCGVAFHAISSVFFQAYVKAISGGRSRPAGVCERNCHSCASAGVCAQACL
jgi:hypothetical protein